MSEKEYAGLPISKAKMAEALQVVVTFLGSCDPKMMRGGYRAEKAFAAIAEMVGMAPGDLRKRMKLPTFEEDGK